VNREAWLQHAAELMRPWLTEAGVECPAVHVSVGFPSRSALSRNRQRIGECWAAKQSADGVSHIFITPLIAEGNRALDVLLHEMVHAAVGTECGHKGPFVRVAKAVGLTGKMTATEASPELTARLNALGLPPYPHAALNPAMGRKKQSTRLLKVACEVDDYIVRMSRTTIDEKGLPICPVCHEPMEEAQ
jgi:hypothetical protein